MEGLATSVALLRQETINGKLTWHQTEGGSGEYEGVQEVCAVAHALAASKEFQGAFVAKRKDGTPILVLFENPGKPVTIEEDKDNLIQDLHAFATLYSIDASRCGRCREFGGGYRDRYV